MPELDANQQKLQAFLARSDVPEDAKRKAVALYDATRAEQAHVARQRIVTEGFREAMPTGPAIPPEQQAQFVRAAPAVAGAIKGGETGAELGAPYGPWGVLGGAAIGAGLGAMPPEAALWLGQHALGLPQGQQEPIQRTAEAGRQGLKAEFYGRTLGPVVQKGLEAVGQVGSKLASRIGLRKGFGIEGGGASEQLAAGRAATPGAAGVVRKAALRQGSQIAKAGQQVLDDMGIREHEQVVTQRATRAMRTAFRDLLTRGVRKGPAGYPDAGELVERLPLRLGKHGYGVAVRAGETSERIENLINHTITEATVAERLAANPGAFDALIQRTGRPVADEMRRSWWTKTLTEATGTKGLQKGVLDASKVVDDFDGRTPQWRQQMFGENLPQVTRFIETLRGMPLGGAVPEKIKPIPWTVLSGGLAALLGHGSFQRAAQAVGGATVGLAVPFVVAKMLTTPQGAEFLTRVLTSSTLSTAAQVAPAAIRAGAQVVTQTKPAPPPKVPDHVQVPP
jgi:hypothetical protein